MNHDEVESEQLLDLYLMGRLSPERQQDFEQHLLLCEQCTRALEVQDPFVLGIKQLGAQDFAPLPRPDMRWRTLALAASVLLAVTGPLSIWSLHELAGQRDSVDTLLASDARILVMPLVQTRGADTANVVELGPVPQWLIFELEGDFQDAGSFAVTLAREGEPPLQSNHLQPDYRGVLVLAVPSNRLEPGSYCIEARPGADVGSPERFGLQVVAGLH